jgi:hypothetical protein
LLFTGSGQTFDTQKYKTLQDEWKFMCNIFRPVVEYTKEKI